MNKREQNITKAKEQRGEINKYRTKSTKKYWLAIVKIQILKTKLFFPTNNNYAPKNKIIHTQILY